MESKVKLYRVILNILFYIFYVLLVSIAFSFVFPMLLVILWKDVWLSNDPKFATIQTWIIVLVLIFSLIFRKTFYLPILEKVEEKKVEDIKTEKTEKNNSEPVKEKEVTMGYTERVKLEKNPELDIKIGKEIK